MKIQTLLLVVVVSIALLSGCNEDNNKQNPVTPTPTPNTVTMRIDTTAITLAGELEPVRFLIRKGEFNNLKLDWSITSKPDWVAVSKTSGVVEFWPDTLYISPIMEGLAYGNYSGTLKFTSNGGTANITISLSHFTPLLLLAKTILLFDRDMYQEDLVIANNGGDALYWTIEDHPSWISLSQTSGYASNANPDEVTVRVNLWQLPYGDHEGMMHITSNGGNSEVVINVSYYRVIEIFSGIGGAKIDLGDSYDNIKAVWGSYESTSMVELPDKRLKHTVYYNSRGFEFDFITTNVVLFGNGDNVYMRFSSPYDGLTEKNIGLDSSVNDVLTAYGAPDQDDTAKRLLVYNTGIGFEYNANKTTLKKIHIFPPIEN